MRWTPALLLSLALACKAGAPATNDANPPPSTPPEASAADGHALLDAYVAALREAASSGPPPLAALVADHAVQLKNYERDGRLDATFRDRYRRLLDISQVALAPAPDDAARARDAAQLEAFAREVQGPDAAPLDPNGGLASLGPVLLEEALSLHMLLDGATDREQARAKYLGASP